MCGSEVMHGMVSESTTDRERKGVDRHSTGKHRGESFLYRTLGSSQPTPINCTFWFSFKQHVCGGWGACVTCYVHSCQGPVKV